MSELDSTAPFVSVEAAAAYLGLPKSTIHQLIRKGTFPVPVVHMGRRVLVNRAALEALAQAS